MTDLTFLNSANTTLILTMIKQTQQNVYTEEFRQCSVELGAGLVCFYLLLVHVCSTYDYIHCGELLCI